MEHRNPIGGQNTSDTGNTNASPLQKVQESNSKPPVDEPIAKQVQVSVSNQTQ